jgi:hypothetical protein
MFSKSLDETTLLKKVQDCKSLLVVGCSACGNFSIAYEKDRPVYQKKIDPTTNEVQYLPIAVVEESKRLKTFFETQGFKVDFNIYRPPCLVAYETSIPENFGGGEYASPDFTERHRKYDVVISLACAGGTLGLRKRLRDIVKIIPGMVTIGMGQFTFRFDEAQEYIYVVKKATTIIPLGKKSKVPKVS